ncbi:hypothetical protein BGZ61DRAFT_448522 [Ilyonectria robusta]|uniref:uncharacterized protein n=1 Tax=Ilyonectria robusta TaxID=1079257 RepID=UPI001E8CBD4F|nr:uncharacterized protein BGZ61DRAFT_448522 [Ilyonectria robusta]KAH8714156.1 hypothetical protein BGZ61DRAFT_448522 [Ilyonectria robusta]
MGSATTPGPRRPRASAAPDLLASVASLPHAWGLWGLPHGGSWARWSAADWLQAHWRPERGPGG